MPKTMVHRCASICYSALAASAAIVIAIVAQAGTGGFEAFEPRATSEVVPSDEIQGPHFRLGPTVQTFGYFDNFLVASDYGAFAAPSDAMLRRLIREVHAISVLQGITTSDAYLKALGQAAMGSVRGVQSLVNQPVETIQAVPTAIFDVFSRVGQGIETVASGQKTTSEDSAAAQALSMSSYKRDYAKQLGVDPYSSNPVLQKQLNSVAWAAAVGNLTVGVASLASGSAAVSALSYARNLDQAINIVADQPPAELMIRNRAALDQMGIDPGLKQQFLGQRQYSPRAKTILISALAAMTATSGRESVLQVALFAPNEETAIFYQQMAELLNAYDERISHIVRLARYNHMVVAYLQRGGAVVLLPVDRVIWDAHAASAATGISQAWHLKPGGDTLELWITGTASPRFKQETAARGIRVREDVAKQLPLLD